MFEFFKKIFSTNRDEDIRNAISANALLVDVRSIMEFSAGSIPGAINVPVDEIEKNLALFKEVNVVLVFCQSGLRSTQAIRRLNRLGVNHVVNGISWKKVNGFIEGNKTEEIL